MIVNKVLQFNYLIKSASAFGCRVQIAKASTNAGGTYLSKDRYILGNRDYVGFGRNGSVHYIDLLDWPMPAVRFGENTNELLALREKEKGDWRKLTCEEKKTLYRASFRQTFAEAYAPTGDWKGSVTWILWVATVALWLLYAEITFLLPELPSSMQDENRRLLLRKTLDLKHGIITGVSSKWDYEKDDWK